MHKAVVDANVFISGFLFGGNPRKIIEEIAKEISGAKQYYLQKFIPAKILNPQFKRKVAYADDEFLNFQKTAAKYVEYCGIR